MRWISRFACVTVTVMLCSCASDIPDNLNARVAYWRDRVATEVPVGTPKSRLEEWVGSIGGKASLLPSSDWLKEGRPQYVIFSLETLKGDGLVCSRWEITGKATLEAEKVKEYLISRHGVCL